MMLHTMEARQGLWRAILDTIHEYDRAKEKHGDFTLDGARSNDLHKITALTEEIGEVARAMTYDEGDVGHLRVELIQVANVALTWAATL